MEKEKAAHVGGREQTTIRLPTELKEQLQKKADAFSISLNAYIIRCLRMALEAE